MKNQNEFIILIISLIILFISLFVGVISSPYFLEYKELEHKEFNLTIPEGMMNEGKIENEYLVFIEITEEQLENLLNSKAKNKYIIAIKIKTEEDLQ